LSAYFSQPFLLAVPPWSRPISPHRTRCQAGLNQTTRRTKKNKGHLATKQEVGQLFPDAVNSFTPTAQLNKSALSAYASSHRYFAVQRIATPTWQELVSLALVGFRPEPPFNYRLSDGRSHIAGSSIFGSVRFRPEPPFLDGMYLIDGLDTPFFVDCSDLRKALLI